MRGQTAGLDHGFEIRSVIGAEILFERKKN